MKKGVLNKWTQDDTDQFIRLRDALASVRRFENNETAIAMQTQVRERKRRKEILKKGLGI